MRRVRPFPTHRGLHARRFIPLAVLHPEPAEIDLPRGIRGNLKCQEEGPLLTGQQIARANHRLITVDRNRIAAGIDQPNTWRQGQTHRDVGGRHLAGRLQFRFKHPGKDAGIFQEMIMAGPPVGDGRHQDFVEIQSHPDGADGKTVFHRRRCHPPQGFRIGDALVGQPVGNEDDLALTIAGGRVAQQLNPLPQPRPEVGAPAGAQRFHRRGHLLAVGAVHGHQRQMGLYPIGIGHQGQTVVRGEPVEQPEHRLAGVVQFPAFHRTTAIQDDHQVRGLVGRVGKRGQGGRRQVQGRGNLAVAALKHLFLDHLHGDGDAFVARRGGGGRSGSPVADGGQCGGGGQNQSHENQQAFFLGGHGDAPFV